MMRLPSPHRAAAVAVVLTGMLLGAAADAQVRRPLTQDNKKALYQRVITVPGAVMAAGIGDRPDATRRVPPFSTYYVYDRRTRDGRAWLEVGSDSNGTVDGWIVGDEVVDWKQTLTVAFRDSAEQERVLLFGDRSSLKGLLDANDAEGYARLRSAALAGGSAASPVVAIQPEGFLDIRKDFYLIPILDHEDVLVGGEQARLLHVATVPLQDSAAIASAYRSGIVFVIDTTVSMKPYIDSTRRVMRQVYEAIDAADLSDRVSYGLVAFRDNIESAPGLEYVARTYASLADGASGKEFLARAGQVKEAQVSSEGFNEDAYAGIEHAIRTIDWSDFYARYVVLITDAGPRVGGDPLATTPFDTDGLRRVARDKNIALSVFHLRTPAGAANHADAEKHYRALTRIPGIGEFYYPVETGNVDSFQAALSGLTGQLTAQVREAASGRPPTRVAAGSAAQDELGAFQDKFAKLGYALRMRFLRESAEQRVPSLFDAWMVDRDFANPQERSVDVRVLLTRNQLSDLHEVLRQVLIRAEEGTLAPDTFLDELKSLAATISRDPQAAKTATRAVGGQSLADLGYMREYLEGLPYRSEVMNLDLSIWEQWPAQRQFEFVNQLDSKVAYYRALHDNVDLWVSLDRGPVDGDSVYPLLLEALP